MFTKVERELKFNKKKLLNLLPLENPGLGSHFNGIIPDLSRKPQISNRNLYI